MGLIKIFRQFLLTVCLIILLPSLSHSDAVILNSGKVIKGEITLETPVFVRIKTQDQNAIQEYIREDIREVIMGEYVGGGEEVVDDALEEVQEIKKVIKPTVKTIQVAKPDQPFESLPDVAQPQNMNVEVYTEASVGALGLDKYTGSAQIDKKPQPVTVEVEKKKPLSKIHILIGIAGIVLVILILLVLQKKKQNQAISMRKEQTETQVSTEGSASGEAVPSEPEPAPKLSVGGDDDPATESSINEYCSAIPRIFIYPLKGRILPATLGGALFFTIMHMAMFMPFYGLIVFLMFVGYTMACNVSIIQQAAYSDEEKMFEWPSFLDWFDWIGKVFLVIISWLICYMPAILWIWKVSKQLPPDMVFWILLTVGSLISPMYFLTIALVGGIQSLNIIGIFRCVKDTILTYILMLIVLAFISFLSGLIYMTPLLKIPVWGNLLRWFFFCYFMIVTMRVLGTFYRANRNKLRWFGED